MKKIKQHTNYCVCTKRMCKTTTARLFAAATATSTTETETKTATETEPETQAAATSVDLESMRNTAAH